ncbi:MAG: hypothetical protein ABWY37_11070 [Microbacterium pygmaeum]
MTSKTHSTTPSIAIWYFVGATFIFAAPTLFFPGSPWWVTAGTLALGLVAMVLGGIQLGREIQQQRASRATPPPVPPADSTPPPRP